MNQIFYSAAKLVQLLCNATRINLDPPAFNDSYVSFPLTLSHDIEGDFYIRPQGVGINIKAEDFNLFYLLQDDVHQKDIEFQILCQQHMTRLFPVISGDGKFDKQRNPCTGFMAAIGSGNVKECSDIPISRSSESFEARAEFLANLLFTQWIVKMMPTIERYEDYKRLRLLAA